MRHVARTHRVALDWLFDRINLDTKIQIRYIDTKHQMAELEDKREFHTWWVELSSSFVQHQPFQLSLLCQEFQLDQLHQNDGDSPIASRSPRILEASSRQIGSSGKLGVRSNQNSNPDAASSCQGWERDAPLDISTGELVGICGIWTRRKSRKPLEFQKIQKIWNPKVEFGHIISIFHHIVLITWRRYSGS